MMDKGEFLKHVKTYVSAHDGRHYVLSAKYFLSVLKLESIMKHDVIGITQDSTTKSVPTWKTDMTELITRMLNKHNDLYVVLIKKPTISGNLENFLFDAVVFNNISITKVRNLMKVFNEKERGLYSPYENILKLKDNKIAPYYSKLIPLPKERKLGLWVLRKYYK